MSSWDINYESQAVLWLPAMDVLIYIQHLEGGCVPFSPGQERVPWAGRITASPCLPLFSWGPKSAFAVVGGVDTGWQAAQSKDPSDVLQGDYAASDALPIALWCPYAPENWRDRGWDIKKQERGQENGVSKMLMSAENGVSMDLTGGMADLPAHCHTDSGGKTKKSQVRPHPQWVRNRGQVFLLLGPSCFFFLNTAC